MEIKVDDLAGAAIHQLLKEHVANMAEQVIVHGGCHSKGQRQVPQIPGYTVFQRSPSTPSSDPRIHGQRDEIALATDFVQCALESAIHCPKAGSTERSRSEQVQIDPSEPAPRKFVVMKKLHYFIMFCD
jgi:hypothetical protein